MQVWSVPTAAPARHAPAAALIDCIARPDFATRALAEVNRTLPVAWWTMYRMSGPRAEQPPRLFAQASHAVPDIALDCWRLYRSGIYRDDAHLARACDLCRDGAGEAAGPVMTHCVADDFDAPHRDQIYTAHSLSERLSLVCRERTDAGVAGADGTLLAVNLYRHRAQPCSDTREIDTMLDLAATLLAVVQRHVELDDAQLTPARRLQQCCPALTPRELEVCERLLRGWTFDGIGADLGLTAATIKTYRNRAFERLGIHHRNELFGLALNPPA